MGEGNELPQINHKLDRRENINKHKLNTNKGYGTVPGASKERNINKHKLTINNMGD